MILFHRKFSGLCVSDGIINNIIYRKNNKSYHIPILPEKYNKDLPEYKKFRIYSHYDLNELDNKILLDHNQTNKEYKGVVAYGIVQHGILNRPTTNN